MEQEETKPINLCLSAEFERYAETMHLEELHHTSMAFHAGAIYMFMIMTGLVAKLDEESGHAVLSHLQEQVDAYMLYVNTMSELEKRRDH